MKAYVLVLLFSINHSLAYSEDSESDFGSRVFHSDHNSANVAKEADKGDEQSHPQVQYKPVLIPVYLKPLPLGPYDYSAFQIFNPQIPAINEVQPVNIINGEAPNYDVVPQPKVRRAAHAPSDIPEPDESEIEEDEEILKESKRLVLDENNKPCFYYPQPDDPEDGSRPCFQYPPVFDPIVVIENPDFSEEEVVEDTDNTEENVAKENVDLAEENVDLPQEENIDLAEENSDLAKENSELVEEIVDLVEENADLAKENADLTEENSDLADVNAIEESLLNDFVLDENEELSIAKDPRIRRSLEEEGVAEAESHFIEKRSIYGLEDGEVIPEVYGYRYRRSEPVQYRHDGDGPHDHEEEE